MQAPLSKGRGRSEDVYNKVTTAVELAIQDIPQLVSHLAEPALGAHGLLMRPILFFERYDRFRAREGRLMQNRTGYLAGMSEAAALRFVRAYAFAEELSQDVLRNFYPQLPPEGKNALCMLWGAAVVLDHYLDDEGIDPTTLVPIRNWVTRQAGDNRATKYVHLRATNPGLQALVSMLGDILSDCLLRGWGDAMYPVFIANLTRMLEAELASVSVTLEVPPNERVRATVHDKGVLLSWVGFQAGCLGQPFEPSEASEFRELCDALGEVLWIMDDLVDLEEDLERGLWNRALWRLYDELGEVGFRELIASKKRLAEGITEMGLVEREIEEIAERVAFLERNPRVQDPEKVNAMMSFWITSWMGIYR